MLFDPEREKRQLFELGKPSLEALSYALRHQELWPEGFKWDFMHCHSCAMGLAHRLWRVLNPINKDETAFIYETESMCIEFNMPKKAVDEIFWGRSRGYFGFSGNKVTAEMVAAEIDKYLAEKA